MTLPFPQNSLSNTLLCPGIFFSLPTQEFFRGQGKIKVGTETKKHSHFLTYSREEMGAQNIMVNCLFLYK